MSNHEFGWVVDIASVPVETELYDLLGVHPTATEGAPLRSSQALLATYGSFGRLDEIKKAYRKKVRLLICLVQRCPLTLDDCKAREHHPVRLV